MQRILYAEVYLICILVVSLLLYWAAKKETRSSSERWLIWVLLCFLCSFASNFLFSVFNGLLQGSKALVPVSYAFKTLYFITLSIGVYAWCMYSEMTIKSKVSKTKKSMLLLALPLLIPIVGALVNLKTHHLFYIDESGEYSRQYMFHFLMLYLSAATVICSVRLLHRSYFELDPTRKSHLHMTALFPLCIIGAWLLSFVGESVPVICVSIMFALLFMYNGAQDQQISKDMLTQVNNRQNLISFVNYRIANHEEKIYLLMIDVDFFKTINDTYGHLEGDRTLIYVATTLKQACASYKRRPYIARYGGDEFMVVLEGTRQDVNQLVESIRALLNEKKPEDIPYNITLSIGLAEYQVGMTAKELIAAADAEMYKIKQHRR